MKTISIKSSLLNNFFLVIVLLASAIIGITFFGNQETVKKLSGSLIKNTIDHTETKLHSFFHPVSRHLTLSRSWGEIGMLDTDRPEYLRRLFMPILNEYKQISSILIADSRGREFMLLRMNGTWINRVTKRDIWKDKVAWYQWKAGSKTAKRSWRKLDYDPRTRPWYKGAIMEKERNSRLHWTKPYAFFTTGLPGITASTHYSTGDKIDRVVGIDVLLTDVSKFTTGIKASENGKVVILTVDEMKIIGLPRSKRYKTEKSLTQDLLKKPGELKDPLLAKAIVAYSKSSRDLTVDIEPVRFKTMGQYWYVAMRHYSLSDNQSLLIAALVPETDVLGSLTKFRLWVIAITLVVLAIAIFRAYVLAKRYADPIGVLVQQSERISRGHLYEGDDVKSTISELQRLADAHEKMRLALTSLLRLERDLHLARQIQQNTFPRKLPTVSGFEIEAFSQPAEETGGDTYDVIGFNHVSEEKGTVLANDSADYAALLMADATGHGVGPALSASEVRAMLRMAIRSGERLDNIATFINDQLCQDLHAGRFITAWLCLIDSKESTLCHFSAGQAPIIHYKSAAEDFDIKPANTAPFGIVQDLEIEIEEPIKMESNDLFLVMSDGLYEAVNSDGEQFGIDRVLHILKRYSTLNAAEIMLKLRLRLNEFTGDVPATDDRTVVLIKKSK